MIDTNELRRLAQAAMHPVTKGRWMRLFGERTVYDRMEDGCRGIPVVSTPVSPPHPFEAACLDFIAAANPAAVIEILDRLEAAESEALEQARLNGMGAEREAALLAKLEAAEKDIAIKEEVIDSLATVIKRLDAQCDAAEKERDALRAKIASSNEAWKSADRACHDLTEKVIPNLREQVEAAEKERDWHAGRCEDAMNECAALRAQIEAAEKQGPGFRERCTPSAPTGCSNRFPLYAFPGAKTQGEEK